MDGRVDINPWRERADPDPSPCACFLIIHSLSDQESAGLRSSFVTVATGRTLIEREREEENGQHERVRGGTSIIRTSKTEIERMGCFVSFYLVVRAEKAFKKFLERPCQELVSAVDGMGRSKEVVSERGRDEGRRRATSVLSCGFNDQQRRDGNEREQSRSIDVEGQLTSFVRHLAEVGSLDLNGDTYKTSSKRIL